MDGDAGGALSDAIAGTYKGGKGTGNKHLDRPQSAGKQYNDAKFGFGGKKRRCVSCRFFPRILFAAACLRPPRCTNML